MGAQPQPSDSPAPGTLHQALVASFSLNELRDICFELDVNYEELPDTQGTVSGLARELIRYMVRRRRLDELLTICQQQRPGFDWADLSPEETDEEGPAPGAPPFKGLEYFTEEDANLFFGRQSWTNKLYQRLVPVSPGVDGQQFLAVVGASGSGKSSLVRAGLIPAMRALNWPIHIITPAAHPLKSLATSLTRDSESVTMASTLMDDLARDERSLDLYASRLVAGQEQRLLLVVDQFEELFSLCRSEEERLAFVNNLTTAVAPETAGPTVVVITLRADFYHRCADYEGLRELLAQYQDYIGTMSEEEIREVIVEPAVRNGWQYEDGLVERILKDVSGEPGGLPLLSHALDETWNRRQGRLMTHKGYQEAGEVKGAIAKTADAIYGEALTPEQQVVARNIFLRLTELGEGTKETRRRASKKGLITDNEAAGLVEEVLGKLIRARLVTTTSDGNAYEVAHEALIREWPTLRGWLEDGRVELLIHRRLTDAALEWDANERNSSYLFRGARLSESLQLAQDHSSELNQLERDFLSASKAAARRTQVLIAAAAIAVVVVVVASLIITIVTQDRAANDLALEATRVSEAEQALALEVTQVSQAEAVAVEARATSDARLISETQSRSRELALLAESTFASDPVEGLKFALKAINVTASENLSATSNAEATLYRIVSKMPLRRMLTGYKGDLEWLSFSPDGQRIVAIGRDETWTWDKQGNYLSSSEADTRLNGDAYSFPEDHLATQAGQCDPSGFGECSEAILFWDLDGKFVTAVPKASFEEDILAGLNLDSFPNRALVTCTEDDFDSECYSSSIRIEKVEGDQSVITTLDNIPAVTAYAVSPDGQHLITAGLEQLRLWSIGADHLARVQEDGNHIRFADLSPDGSHMLTVNRNGTAQLWDGFGDFLTGVGRPGQSVESAIFSPDGATIMTTHDDGAGRLWDLNNNLLTEIKNPGGEIKGAVFAPDGQRIVTTGGENTARVWDVAGNPIQVLEARHQAPVITANFSDDGNYLVTADVDANVALWRDDGGLTFVTTLGGGDEQWVGTDAIINADGSAIVTGDSLEMADLWDGEGNSVGYLDPPIDQSDVSFSPDGRTVIIAGCGSLEVDAGMICSAGNVVFWDATDGTLIHEFSPFPGYVYAARLNATGDQLLTLGCPHSHIAANAEYGEYCDFSALSLWKIDLASQSETLLVELDGPIGDVEMARFNATGNRIFSLGYDDGVRLWEAYPDLDSLLREAQKMIGPLLTEDECQSYFDEESCS